MNALLPLWRGLAALGAVYICQCPFLILEYLNTQCLTERGGFLLDTIVPEVLCTALQRLIHEVRIRI